MTTVHLELLLREDVLAILKISSGTLDKYLKDKVIPDGRKLPDGRQLYWRSDEFWEAVEWLLPYRAPALTDPLDAQPSGPERPAIEPAPRAASQTSDAGRRPPVMPGSAAERARRRATAQLAEMNAR
jgi:hypothetical protein